MERIKNVKKNIKAETDAATLKKYLESQLEID